MIFCLICLSVSWTAAAAAAAAGVELSLPEYIPDIPDTCKNNNKYNLINLTNIYMCQQIAIKMYFNKYHNLI